MKIVILAAGKGKRLQSEKFNLPKVLRKINNKPLIGYVLEQLDFVEKKDIYIIIGYMGQKVIDYCSRDYNYAWQTEQLGTAHALKQALIQYPDLNSEEIIVLMGDMPFIKKETIKSLIEYNKTNKNDITLISTFVDLPSSFGRIVRNQHEDLVKIIEVKDADENILKINEVNTGIAIYNSKALNLIELIKNNNNQKEYYLTDLIHIGLKNGLKVKVLPIKDKNQFLGINTLDDLEKASRILKTSRGT